MKEALLGPCRSAVLKQGLFLLADQDLLNKAINAAVAARKEWDLWPVQKRAEIFFKAADMLSGPRRAEVLAKTMIGQVRYWGGGVFAGGHVTPPVAGQARPTPQSVTRCLFC